MNDTIIITSIYQPFWGTYEFYKSTKRLGLPVHNAFKGNKFTGNGDVLRYIYEALIEYKDLYKYAIYADGADSIFLKKFTPPDYILYSTEKAIWPPLPLLQQKWDSYYRLFKPTTPWLYLNGGGYCGPIELLLEFFQRYLDGYKGDVNGQYEQSMAFFEATKDRFPIHLDHECMFFQTTAFEDPGDFEMNPQAFKNLKTGYEPCILHGNGRTDMTKLYETYNR